VLRVNTPLTARDSSGTLDWLHERMPAILPTADAVQRWLDPEVHGKDAADLLQPNTKDQVKKPRYPRPRPLLV
jgi:putative SOS response-associated peptidase YedK